MSQSTTQFITQMKLRELHRQRVLLREAYRRLGEQAAGAREAPIRLRRLYDGLRGLTFAGQPLHPEVVNLEILLHEAEAGTIAPDILELWLNRLGDELEAGRVRAEFVYLFGALLEEWTREGSGERRLQEESREARRRLLREATADPPPNRHEDVLGPLFAGFGTALEELASRLREKCGNDLRAPIEPFVLVATLKQLGADIYRPPYLRREARRFAADDLLRKELADALTILVAELHTWDWPSEALATRALWTRNKWRLYLDEDLPTACLLEIVGGRWATILESLLGDKTMVDARRARLKALTKQKAPAVILENERRMLREAEQQMVGLLPLEEADPWEAGPASPGTANAATTLLAAQPPAPGSVVQRRGHHQHLLRSLHVGSDYEGDYGAVNRAVQLVNAEIQLARAAFPGRPLFVVKVDLQDYYSSIPHDVLMTVLGRLGLAESDLAFFARFLAPSLRGDDGRSTRLQRGLPMGHALSGLLAEMLMRLLERHVQRRRSVRIVRLVDDICLLTPDSGSALAAWGHVEEFRAACGLRVNASKSGAVGIGGTLPDGLPRGRPRWGMLELDELGHWHVHRETFESHRTQTRERVAAATSVLSRVQQYNANVKYLLNALALGGKLGGSHRESAGRAVRSFHRAFFGEGRGIVADLCAAIRERFLSDAGRHTAIPEGWVHWPITAGGLGLRNPLVTIGQYAEADRKLKAVAVPEARPVGWDFQLNDWSAYYDSLLASVQPDDPKETKVMKTLVDDFIARGSDLSAGKQKGLTSYWRWILCTYGPQILRSFGTFRFLITELVPLQLIGRQLVQDSSLDHAGQSATDRA